MAASGYPPDYFEALAAVEMSHWWHRGMRAIEGALLGGRVRRGGAMLDVGCGTGGFLAWAEAAGFGPLTGVDVFEEAVAHSRARLPRATIEVAPAWEIPVADAAFDVVVCNDVLQHIDERMVNASLREMRRALRPDGVLLLRTNGSRRLRRERADWRAYDPRSLRAELAAGGFRCTRLSFVNTVGSLVALVRGRVPHAPTDSSHGIPAPPHNGGGARFALLRAEATLLRVPGVRLPYGHTIVARAVPDDG